MSERTGRAGRGDGPEGPRGEDDALDRREGRRRGRGLAALLLVPLGGLLIYLAWSIAWARSHPAGSVAPEVGKGDAAARLGVIRRLGRVGPEDPEIALPALAEAISDPEPANRTEAIEALLIVNQHVAMSGLAPEGVEAGVGALIGRLGDPEPTIKLKAAEALTIVVLMWQGSRRVLQPDRMIPALEALLDDPDPRMRTAGLKGLGVIGPKVGTEPPPRLVAALDDPSESVRNAAAQALANSYRRAIARLLPALLRAIEATRPECRPAYLSLFKEIQPRHPSSPPPEELVPALAEALGSRDREVRALAAARLVEYQDRARAAVPALIAVLRDPDDAGSPGPKSSEIAPEPPRGDLPKDPVLVAIETLSNVAGNKPKRVNNQDVSVPLLPEIVAALKPLMKSADPHRRANAINALRSFSSDPALIPDLCEAVGDRDERVRAVALMTLGDYAHDLGFPPPKAFVQALDDDDWTVRLAAAQALGMFRAGVEPAVPALIRHARQDPNRDVRGRCEWALGSIRPPKVSDAVAPRFIEAIVAPGSPDSLRRTLIEGLMHFGPAARDVVPALIGVLRQPAGKNDPHEPISRGLLRSSAADALGELAPGGPMAGQAIDALTRNLEHPVVGISAARALGEFGPAAGAAAPDLLRGLERARDRKSSPAVAAFADAIHGVAPGTPEEGKAIIILIDYLDKGDKNAPGTHEVIAAVGRFGPRAAAALPRLLELTASGAPQVEQEARKAVAAIEGPAR